MNVEHCHAVIVVFAMEGCPACEEYKPRLEKEIKRWQANNAPLVIGQKGQTFGPYEVAVIFVDAASEDPQVQQLANDFAIEGVPATILFTRKARPRKIEGAVDDVQIYAMLLEACSR